MTASSFSSLRFATGARVHFGLMEIHESSPNCYGGIGLMVDEPAIVLNVILGHTPLAQVDIAAPVVWQSRIDNVLKHWCSLSQSSWSDITGLADSAQTSGERLVPFKSIELIYEEPAHQGLGSGTQVSSLVAHSLWVAQQMGGRGVSADELKGFSSQTLSDLSQRGLRSHIGLSGYLNGGLIVDPGRGDKESDQLRYVARQIERYPFPDWPILLVQNPEFTGEHGEKEKEMFRLCAASPNFNRERMLELILDDLVAAVQTNNWNRWDRCVGEYGHLAGMIFRDVQSGVFRTHAIRQVVEKFHELGCQGACQSSWGPTVAVAARDPDHARFLANSIQHAFPQLTTRITGARNLGVSVSSKSI